MKLAYIATYPPRECGIGTFTDNLVKSMLSCAKNTEDKHEAFVVALNDNDLTYEYPKEVKLTIRQDHQEDYLRAVKYINLSGADICILEHEFGIFGGDSGVYILPLLHRLEMPLIVTLHTILKTPSYNERAILKEICKMATKIVVMSHKAIEFLTKIYEVPKTKIALIEHGVPDIHFDAVKSKKEFKLENRKVILTFGFIGRSKGIETVIKALPGVVEKYPNIIYIVLGKTHPNVLRHSGEEYRVFLMRLVKSLRLERHVVFLNDDKTTKTAFQTMVFLTGHTLKDNYLSVIGNEKWYKKEGVRSVFAQQPIDAMAMVLMYHQAYHLTKDKDYLNKLYASFLWFLGENDLRMSLYDFETKGCCDGFENYGVNRNQGAESSLAYLISHLTVLQAYEDYHKAE